ncbi:MAG: signal recognition particle protein, partial [Pseudomonadota bacterium]
MGLGGGAGGMGGMPDPSTMDPKQLEEMARQMGSSGGLPGGMGGGMPKLPGLGGPKLPGLGGGSPFGGKKK